MFGSSQRMTGMARLMRSDSAASVVGLDAARVVAGAAASAALATATDARMIGSTKLLTRAPPDTASRQCILFFRSLQGFDHARYRSRHRHSRVLRRVRRSMRRASDAG